MDEKQILKPCRLSLQEQNRIVQLYTKNHLSIQEISKQTHHKDITVSKVLYNHGIDIKLGLRQYIPTDEEVETVRKIIENHQSYKDAARAINRDVTIVKRIIKEHNMIYDYRPYNIEIQVNHGRPLGVFAGSHRRQDGGHAGSYVLAHNYRKCYRIRNGACCAQCLKNSYRCRRALYYRR